LTIRNARDLAMGDALKRREVRNRVLTVVRDWLPLILLIWVYENLRNLTGLIRPDCIDKQLYALDVWLFGVEPTLWIQRFLNPWLTDYFAFAYTLYFIIPLVLGTTLYLRQKREDFRELMVGIILVLYVGYLLYLIFPAGPPRFAIQDLYQPAHLHGRFGFFEATQGVYDGADPLKAHSSFPSLHCGLALSALLYAWRFRRSAGTVWLFWVFLPLVVSLWISTVYLRHHWVVDCFAGFALAIPLYLATPILRRGYARMKAQVVEQNGALR
jgi:membrane-associated phospholipid phosphatase